MTTGQWVRATVAAIIAGIPFGACSYVVAGPLADSQTVGYIAWGATIALFFVVAAGMAKAQDDAAELRKRQLAELREKQG